MGAALMPEPKRKPAWLNIPVEEEQEMWEDGRMQKDSTQPLMNPEDVRVVCVHWAMEAASRLDSISDWNQSLDGVEDAVGKLVERVGILKQFQEQKETT